MNRIFIGYDSNEVQAYTVCEKSILRRASCPVQIIPLKLDALQTLGLYWRPREAHQSTEFSFSRYLVPLLCGYQGMALFCDVDFLFRADIVELLALADPRFAVQVVKHEYMPTQTDKMGGLPQDCYPRKLWSALILWHCGHAGNRQLTAEAVNTKDRLWLHQFSWLPDAAIGSLPEEWHVLPGHTPCETPKAIHFTEGLQAVHGIPRQPLEDVWFEEAAAL